MKELKEDDKYATFQHKIISKLITLKEHDLTINVLMPLFKTMDWLYADHHGGPYEGGKDIIFYKKDEFDLVEYYCVQVKKFKPTARAEDSNNLGLILNQLEQAKEKRIPHLDGNTYLPSFVYFITPYEIDTRSLESRFDAIKKSNDNRIKIIDGCKIADLLRKRLPNIVEQLLGIRGSIQINMLDTLNNNELMGALCNNAPIDISTYYCDLDFGVGGITTKTLLSLNVLPKIVKKTINQENLPLYKKSIADVFTICELELFNRNLCEIEDEFETFKSNNLQIKNDITNINKELEKLEISNANNLALIEIFTNKLRDSIFVTDDKNQSSDIIKFKECYEYLFIKKLEDRNLEKIQNGFEILLQKMEFPFLKTNEYASLKSNQNELNKLISEKKIEIDRLRLNLLSVEITVETKTEAIAKTIKKYQCDISHEIDNLPCNISKQQLTDFILKCEDILGKAEALLKEKIIQEMLGVDFSSKFRMMDQIKRIKFSIHDVIDSGCNLLILGEAGAGKTTTLQMYVKKMIEDEKTKRLVLFLPINQVLRNLKKIETFNANLIDLDTFELGVKCYLELLNINVTNYDLKNIFANENVVLIIDGVDESISSYPDIIKVINAFSKKYSKCQIIASSRMSGSYVNDIDFLSITLLPFDDIQRSKFINHWFNDKAINRSSELLKHITSNKELDIIIRLPLLATIFCVLAENDIKLPNNEIVLYEERFNLLLGLYDTQKKTDRVKSIKANLDLISRKLAYIFHKHEARSFQYDKIVNLLSNSISTKLSLEKIELAVSELIDPCNILVPMTANGEYGFGHLRYQEFLVAKELISNRGIEIVPLLDISWWKESLLLFSKMTDNLDFIIDEISRSSSFEFYRNILSEMLKSRPPVEIKRLSEIIKRHQKLDNYEEIISTDSLFNDYFLKSDFDKNY